MAVTGVRREDLLAPSGLVSNKAQTSNAAKGYSFSDYLYQALDEVNRLQLDAQRQMDDFAAGRTDNIHQVMIAIEKADIALQLTVQVRNKIIDAYNEIMRMQI